LVGNWLILRIAELILVTLAFLSYFYKQVSDTEWREAELLKDVLSTRDDESAEIMFDDGTGLELSHLKCHIKCSDESCMTSNCLGFPRLLLY